jgi:hypothetical protein
MEIFAPPRRTSGSLIRNRSGTFGRLSNFFIQSHPSFEFVTSPCPTLAVTPGLAQELTELKAQFAQSLQFREFRSILSSCHSCSSRKSPSVAPTLSSLQIVSLTSLLSHGCDSAKPTPRLITPARFRPQSNAITTKNLNSHPWDAVFHTKFHQHSAFKPPLRL